MSAVLLATIIAAAPSAQAVEPAEPAASLMKPQELRDAIYAAMRREALAKSRPERGDAIRELVTLHGQAVHHDMIPEKERKRLAHLIRSRLLRVKRRLQADIKRQQRAARYAGGAKPADSLAHDPRRDFGEQVAMLSQSLGGPSSLAARSRASFGGGMLRDDGQLLVDLIQTVIAPQTWEKAGGAGTIMYFPGLHALVVRAQGDVHDQVIDVLDNLRRVGN